MKKILFFLLICSFSFVSAYYFGIAMEGYPTQSEIQAKKTELGGDFDTVLFYLAWAPPGQTIDLSAVSASLDAIWLEGGVPCITWEPWYWQDGGMVTSLHADIINGLYNTYILSVANLCKSKSYPIIIRFAHEMNGNWYHWGTTAGDYGSNSPALYQQIYQYVYNLFETEGVSNALWSFCPNNDSVPNEPWNTATNYYPGNDYVDIMGMDGYNWGDTQSWSSWREFYDLFINLRNELQTISTSKPLIVWETASATSGGNRAKWIRNAVSTTKTWDLRGLVWFQVNKEVDWRLTKKEAATIFRSAKEPISMQQWAQEMLQ